jgi:hypothetical protein
MAIDLTCDISSKRITPGVINLKEFENGTTSMVWTVSSRYTTGYVDLNDFDAYLNLSVRGHIDQIKLTKVLNVDDSISLTWDVGTLSTFLIGYAKYQIVFKASGSGSLYVTCPTDKNANGTYAAQNPYAAPLLRTYSNSHNYHVLIGSTGKWTIKNESDEDVAYKLITSDYPFGDGWNNCTVADTTASVFNTYEALMYISESIASDPSMMAQFPTMLRQWELLLSDKIMSSGLNAVRYEVTESMFTANSGTNPTYFLMLEDIDTTGKPGLIIGAEAFQLEGSAFYTQIANCNFSDNWAGSAVITVPEAFNGYVVVYYSEGDGRWVDQNERLAEIIEHDSSLSGNGTIADPLVAYGDHKAICSVGDVPDYLQNKLVGTDWLNVVQIALGPTEKNIQFALKNPNYFVKGNTIYGGSILPAETGNFDSPVHNGYYTGYYNTLNAPPVQNGNPSWFVHHMNSNVGALYAVQIAYAYTTSIICYERTKINNEWQAWTLRSAGSVSPEIGYVASGNSLGSTATIALQAGSTTQWSAHAVMCAAMGKLTPVVGTSLFGFIVPQTIVGGHFIGAIYKVEDNGTHTKICSTGITEFPAAAQWTHALISSLVTDKFIAPTERMYLTIMTDCNGVAVAGANAGSNLNLQPYIAAVKTNMGVLTEAPATIQFESETNLRPFIYLVK